MTEEPHNELIFKLRATRHYLDDNRAVDMPDLWILGSREGFRWLGQMLLDYADRDVADSTYEHWHLDYNDDVVDQQLSDQVCLRFDLMADNRERCLDQYWITPERVRRGRPSRQSDPDPELGPYTL